MLLHKIEIEGAQLWLENSLDGRPSWVMQRGHPDQGDKAGTSEIRLQSIDVTHLRASYFDAQDGTTRSISLDELTATASQADDPVKIAIRGEIMDLPLAISGTIGSPDQLQGGEPFSFELDSSLGQTQLGVKGQGPRSGLPGLQRARSDLRRGRDTPGRAHGLDRAGDPDDGSVPFERQLQR